MATTLARGPTNVKPKRQDLAATAPPAVPANASLPISGVAGQRIRRRFLCVSSLAADWARRRGNIPAP
ncbi:hypothetical protein GCM10010289_76170 [Streptomyces violascens]|uniref:Integrase n=1 Tax=Streptomyces violascens TaxID=67381 RepID=A0ABQ3QVA9_9ACTN|nr:hypothetical protein GCM10010289_76170 [Streptomyces violascens]GHI41185.1 hypothetical protein Sviol_55930 [Streptomyces violascens]